MSTTETPLVVVGRVRRAHGIKGELVVESLTDTPDAIFASGRRVFAGTSEGEPTRDRLELHVLRSSPFKGGLIIAFEGITDRTTADSWRERTLLLPQSEVEPPGENELFIADLVGMHVVHVNGEAIGDVAAVFELPQGLMMEVRRPSGTSVLLPYHEQTVVKVDAGARTISVDPLEGMLD
ncbi:MAG TPA: ribosome maturation factor RimM [Gemmatimonadaceae bacterium]|nr:ribosome maturation factor RimM [Gemmatimonadaceae bacterium]